MQNFAALLTEYRKTVLAERGTLWYHPDYEFSAEPSEADSIELSENQPLEGVEPLLKIEPPSDAIPEGRTKQTSENPDEALFTVATMELSSSAQLPQAEHTLESTESIQPLGSPLPPETQIMLQTDIQASDIPEASRVLSSAAMAVQRLKRSRA